MLNISLDQNRILWNVRKNVLRSRKKEEEEKQYKTGKKKFDTNVRFCI